MTVVELEAVLVAHGVFAYSCIRVGGAWSATADGGAGMAFGAPKSSLEEALTDLVRVLGPVS